MKNTNQKSYHALSFMRGKFFTFLTYFQRFAANVCKQSGGKKDGKREKEENGVREDLNYLNIIIAPQKVKAIF